MKTQVYIHISKNVIQNRQVLAKAFKELKDGRYKVSIENANHRSNNQNSYVHGVIIPLVYEGLRDAGFEDIKTKEDAKLVIKTLFLKKKIYNPNNGDTIEVTRHTSELTTLEMNEFIEDVIRWGAEYLNIQIPYPNEQLQLSY